MSESFAELFEESLRIIDMKSGAIITGVVVDIDSEWVTVHAGLKSEGVIPREEFLNDIENWKSKLATQFRYLWMQWMTDLVKHACHGKRRNAPNPG